MIAEEAEASTTWILVVSDDARVRDAAGDGFGGSVEVTFASDAREALEILRSATPAVVVVDMHAGSAGGFALCKDMGANPRLARVPVLMLLERDQDAWLARTAGAAIYKTKPVDGSDLVESVLSLSSSAP